MRARLIFASLLLLAATSWWSMPAFGWQTNEPAPNWIWSPKQRAGHIPQSSCYFRKTISLPAARSAMFAIAADDAFELYINGKLAAQGTGEKGILTYDVKSQLRTGDNTFALKVTNREGGTAGLAARLVLRDSQNQEQIHVTDGSWKTSLSSTILWNRSTFFELGWDGAQTLGPFSNFVSQQVAAQRQTASEKQSTEQASKSDNNNSNSNPASRVPPSRTNSPAANAAGSTAASSSANASANATTGTTSGVTGEGFQALTRRPAAGEQLEVPREFELQHIAGHLDVGSLTAMTFDEFGTLIVAREDGQLWRLDDRDEDGVFDALRDYGQLTNTCQGLLALNGELYVTGLADGELGLFRLSDTDQDGKLDKKKRIIRFQGDNIEHGPHGITLGPDGKLYVMVGNHSPMEDAFAASSPYRYPYEGDLLQPRFQDPGGHASGVKAPGGYILRTDPNGERTEIYAGGFRNAYDLAFNRRGALFTHDSDMESDRGSTWYRPTRVYHVIDGGEYGWRSGWAKWPEYFLDNLPGIGDTGRGSPTGMVVYDHDKFPSVYRNALFSCDWSEGRILVFACSEDGATYKALGKSFIQGQPLNVTDIEVGPDGALYFVTGGRGTAGNVYRVAWKGAAQQMADADVGSTIDTVLRQPQMHSSWARQKIAAAQKLLGSRWAAELAQAAREMQRPESERVQALQIMQWIGPAPSVELLTELAVDRRVAVRRQVAFQLGLQPTAASSVQLTRMLADPDPVVRRRASEALARHTYPVDLNELRKPLSSSDRFESWAARRVLETVPREMWQEELLTTDNQRIFLQGATALLLAAPSPQNAQAILERSLHFMNGFVNDDNFVDMLRVQQLAFLRTQVPDAARSQFARRLADEYPSSSATINRELIRLLMFLQVDSINERYLAELQRDWPLPDKLHLALHLTYLKKGWTTDQKLAVFQYLASPPGAGNSLPGYLQNAAHQFGSLLSSDELAQALARGHENPGSALAAMLRMPEKLSDQQLSQIRELDQRVRDRDDEMSRRLKVAILAILARDGSKPATRYLREVYDRDPARRAEVALGLAETDDEANWPYLVRSLPILEPNDARDVIVKLQGYSQTPSDADAYRQVILAAQRLGENGAEDAIALLEHWQGYASNDTSLSWSQALTAWKGWFKDQYPNEPVPELVVSSQRGKWDEEALLKHLTRAEQEAKGSVSAGAQVFAKAQCASCHRFGGQGESMGPDLTGISKRFLKREILDSLLYPSKVISDQYAAKIVYMADGKVYTGIVSEAPGQELLVLQTNGTKVRLPRSEVDEIEPARTSAMPEGLLNDLSLTEITDLFAYLQSDPDRFTLKPSDVDRQ